MASFIVADLFNRYNIVSSFREFIIKNGVLSIASGIIFGIATVNFVTAASKDVVIPMLYAILVGPIKYVHKPTALWFAKNIFIQNTYNFRRFANDLMTWVVVLFVGFLINHYMFRYITSTQSVEEELPTMILNARKEAL